MAVADNGATRPLLEAKKVNHPLSQISKHQQRYPQLQIRDYLSEAQILAWGILTNGNEWRLYCRDAKPSHFFSLNFAVAIQSLENFKYFVALFTPAAFVRDAAGKCRLDAIRESALAAQNELEEDLRQRVFSLVEILANGFAERSENAIPDTSEGHRLLYENCLIFLYRLLFILYAEGRQLLPVEPKSRKYYKDFSLARLTGLLKGFTVYDSQTRTRLYEDIAELCHLINGTDEAKNKEYAVPRYNGGLFDPTRYPELERWRICDAKLADVLRGLMFAKPDRQTRELPLETVDYADLRVQQLGSIYEGLLEHHFIREGGGSLQLDTDKAERKATGTYYTPDYIVKYIVEHTAGSLLAEISQRPEVKAGKEDSFADAVLALNICAPAMGSGHFLVEATTHLADEIVYHPTTKPRAVKDEDERAYWRRRVVEACIYGVDLNPLAVELAKLSLWLTTIATDQPLNFLDHHLRCGNSLIGARLEDIGQVPTLKRKKAAELKLKWMATENLQAALQKAVQTVRSIEASASANIGDVKNKEKLWLDSVRPALLPFRTVANLWTSCYFGNDLPQEDYEALIELLDIHPDKIKLWKSPTEFQNITAEAIQKGTLKLRGREFDVNRLKHLCSFLFRSERSGEERHFFHWELEFPEVFFHENGSRRENPGFDAVIGNPPYVSFGLGRTDTLDTPLRSYFESQYADSAEYKISMYALFIQRASDLLSNGGGSGLILPDSFLTGRYFSKIRRHMVTKTAICRVVRFNKDFWGSGDVGFPVILIWFRMPRGWVCDKDVVEFAECTAPEDLFSTALHYSEERQTVWANAFRNRFRLIPDPADRDVVTRIESQCVPLGDIINLHHGIRSKVGREKVVSGHKVGITWKPGLIGSDEINRYSLWWEGNYLNVEPPLLFHGGWDAEHIEQPKLLIRRTGDRIIAALDDSALYHTNALIYGIPNKPRSHEHGLQVILTIINSRLFEYYYNKTSMKKGRTFPQVEIDTLEQFPIRSIAFTTLPPDRKRLAAQARERYESCLAKNDAAAILNFVEKQLAEKRGDVVHDLLAFLAERMMELSKEKQTAAKQFLTDLRDFHRIESRSLTPKTKLDKFWKLQAGEVFDHLRANLKTLAAQGIRLKDSDEEKIRTRFQKATDKLLPLESQIAFTDGLIDQIVYRLYGLTPAEIKLVESSFAKATADKDSATK